MSIKFKDLNIVLKSDTTPVFIPNLRRIPILLCKFNSNSSKL